jgi:DNA-binding HxlR family transcriptional regulator
MVEPVLYSDHPPRAEYRLTAKGRAFVPVLVALKAYGEEWEPPSAG